MSKDSLTRWGASLRLSDLSDSRSHTFKIEPDTAQMAEMRTALDLLGLKKVRFEGTLSPVGKRDWKLDATLGATVSQPCVVTLAPVSTRIDTAVTRLYLSTFKDPAQSDGEEEVEMPEDDTVEPIPAALVLADVATEALALALPEYPRAQGAEVSVTQFAAPGTEAMTDEDTKPFAGLKALRDKLGKDD